MRKGQKHYTSTRRKIAELEETILATYRIGDSEYWLNEVDTAALVSLVSAIMKRFGSRLFVKVLAILAGSASAHNMNVVKKILGENSVFSKKETWFELYEQLNGEKNK